MEDWNGKSYGDKSWTVLESYNNSGLMVAL